MEDNQHFDLIYNIGISDLNILRNIMKTAQDSCTFSIKQNVGFQERMHPEKVWLLSRIIYFHMPDIW